jgi:uncharacterized coiled-coil protein SlyX
MSDNETRIADLENEIKHRDRRILELKREVDESQMLIAEMREHVQDCSDQTERFIEAFDMVLGDDRSYRWPTVQSQFNELADKHNALVAQWNRMVPSTTPSWRRVVSAARSPQAKLSKPSAGHAQRGKVSSRHSRQDKLVATHGAHRRRQGRGN